jgi:PAS domain S-box-containing protein
MLNHERIRTTREGGVQTVVTTKVPLIDEGGEPYAIVVMARDVTEQRKAREALLRTERQIQDIVDNCPAVVYLKTVKGKYLLVNREYERLFNLGRDEVLGKTDYDIFDAKTADAFSENDALVVEEDEAIRVEELVPQADGDHTYLSMKFPLRDLAGEIYAVGGFSTDITDRKNHEEALRKLNDDLIQTNRNLRETQEQLIQAEKMESVGRLAAGVAHEVKNPLAMIGMGLEIVARRAKEDEKLYDAVERMRRGVERAKDIIKGLVDFSSAHQLHLVDSNLNDVVQEALALAKYQLKKGNVEVVTEFCEELPLAELDATKVEQVLLNLCVNALHAMEEQGGGILTARTRTGLLKGVFRDEGARTKGHLREGDRYVAVDILDNGPGVDESKIAKIFDPFFTTKATGVGTGLGLSVARKILDLHHGMLEIVNQPEGGVRATLTFKACVDG